MPKYDRQSGPGKSNPGRNGHHPKPKPACLDDFESAQWAMRTASTREAPPRDIADRLPPEWGEACLLAEDEGPGGIEAWLKASRLRTEPSRLEAIQEALEQARAEPTNGQAVAEAKVEPPRINFGILGSAAFSRAEYPRRWLVEHILVERQPCIVGGPRKALKTSQMVDLVVSLAAADPFLGEFPVLRPHKVLFLSGESGESTVQETARRVCKAKGFDLEQLEGQLFWGFKLPKLSDPEHVAALAEFIRTNGIEVVVLDPLYLCLLSANNRVDVANLFEVGPALATVAEACLDAGATPIMVHHLRKNRDDADAPPELEDLAFAGAQEFARQWLLVGRRARYEPGTGEHKLWLSVGGSAGHSGAWAVDVSEGVIDDEFNGRLWNVTITRASEARAISREQANEARAQQQAERARLAEEQRIAKLESDCEKALGVLQKLGGASKTRWKEALVFDNKAIGAVIYRLEEKGLIRSCQVPVSTGRGGRMVPGYEPTSAPSLSLPEVNPENPEVTPENPEVTGFTGSNPEPVNPKEEVPPLKGGFSRVPGSPGSKPRRGGKKK